MHLVGFLSFYGLNDNYDFINKCYTEQETCTEQLHKKRNYKREGKKKTQNTHKLKTKKHQNELSQKLEHLTPSFQDYALPK